jgi:hypothetical protein
MYQHFTYWLACVWVRMFEGVAWSRSVVDVLVDNLGPLSARRSFGRHGP